MFCFFHRSFRPSGFCIRAIRVLHRTGGLRFLLPTALVLLACSRSFAGGLLPGNIWPNPTLELDSDRNGIPDFWHRGGSDPTFDEWSTELSVSPTHCFILRDDSKFAYGEWYSDRINISGGTIYQLRYNLRYVVTNIGPMRVTVNFYDAANQMLPGLSYLFSGNPNSWEEMTQSFNAPANARRLNLSFTSGGGLEVTGWACLDDISLAPFNPLPSLVPYLESFPLVPNPLVIRDWKRTAIDYVRIAFHPSLAGRYLPLLYPYDVVTAAGYSGPAFSLPSYVGRPRDSGEAITVLGAVLGGTLAGLNMGSWDGIDRVQQCEAFYCLVNGHGLVLNNLNSQGSGSAWYDIFPSTLFYQIGARYPGRSTLDAKMRAIAESWLAALPVLNDNWEHAAFSFRTMTPVDGGWTEPDMAIGIAWLEYMAYLRFQDERYLAAADSCMTQMDNRSANPLYETLGLYGPILAARMNAELGRDYSTAKHLNWVFSPGSDARPGWGCVRGRWGDYDAYGLIGSTTDSSGYAFSMNSFTAAGLLAPVARYEPKFARLLGRWLLHVAANANLFYPDTLPENMQSSFAWAQETGITNISYEGVRHLGTTTPYATGDASDPIQDLNPYGAWASGYLAALYRTSNVPGILQVDCVAPEAFARSALPTFLFYNPHSTAKQITLNLGSDLQHLYDAVGGVFLATNTSGITALTVPSDRALVVVQCPATGAVTQVERKLLVGGVIVDYWNGIKDTDGDGLPDWWESRFYAHSTNALPQATAANGMSNLDSYRLGLDPTDTHSTFRAQAGLDPASGYAVITWKAVGGKSYAVQYTGDLSGFTQALTTIETNVPAGVETTATFVDDYTFTGGPPGQSGRYYRIRLATPPANERGAHANAASVGTPSMATRARPGGPIIPPISY